MVPFRPGTTVSAHTRSVKWQCYHSHMHAGFVLVGGKSSRMHRDKALLPWRGTTLAQHVARIVHEAAGSVTLIGEPALYARLGYPVRADLFAGCGPVGGIATALTLTTSEWALITGCDMPGVSAASLRRLLHETATAGCDCIVPLGPAGPEPLCAVYHRAALSVFEKAIAERRFKLRDIVDRLRTRTVPGLDPENFANLNTPEEFQAFSHK